ncbi:molecular chaperone GrpE [Marisediminitalea aggregata]|uniref:Protein GrpE n=1 Tax=Marisediminitalea aggregata TaxID=634436 RepID=A0A1M5JXS1_9ALTE|nr:nucleotide exchange factor GrpE [Marisediminitalea aggregata]MAP21807.1 nucleotide exchange factor GrpE [Alteromonadaceae bacterium]MEC7823832.1 nucleotide exchange factor GrpE [Pseudomonadota bacterium]HBY37997.1 nucleotide exchange factor GrpE [Alteromonas sp.]MAX42295.1 nucleotide exchange factor GrpE [Alteromonadaceae bacterium]SHG45318.1 molecular chaperone GrpE [Marisediminitalea aggregata]
MSEPRDVQTEEQEQTEAQQAAAETVDEQVEAAESAAVEGEIVDESAARIAELEKALAASEAKFNEQQDSVLRARAEMENARRRAEAEVDKARKFALERFAGELLDVIDNLERAVMVADTENEAIKPMLEGVEMTLKSFVSTIEKFGMTPIDPQGEAFNPELHQAMSMQESADFAPNTVMAVMQKGYELNGRLLRPAMVMVSRAPDGGVDTQA